MWDSPRPPLRTAGTPVSAPIETCNHGASVAPRGQLFPKSPQSARDPPPGTRRRGGALRRRTRLRSPRRTGRHPRRPFPLHASTGRDPSVHRLTPSTPAAPSPPPPTSTNGYVRERGDSYCGLGHKPLCTSSFTTCGSFPSDGSGQFLTSLAHSPPERTEKGSRDFPVTRAVHYHQPTRPIRQRHKGIDIPCHPRSVRC